MLLNIILPTEETKQLRRIFLGGFAWICPKQSTRSLGYMHTSPWTKEVVCFSSMQPVQIQCFTAVVCRLPGYWITFQPKWRLFLARSPQECHHFPTSFPPGHQGWKISKPCKKYDMFLSHTCPGSKESQRTSSGVSRTICNPKSPHIPQII